MSLAVVHNQFGSGARAILFAFLGAITCCIMPKLFALWVFNGMCGIAVGGMYGSGSR